MPITRNSAAEIINKVADRVSDAVSANNEENSYKDIHHCCFHANGGNLTLPETLTNTEFPSANIFLKQYKKYQTEGGKNSIVSFVDRGLLAVLCYKNLGCDISNVTDEILIDFLKTESAMHNTEDALSELYHNVKNNLDLPTSKYCYCCNDVYSRNNWDNVGKGKIMSLFASLELLYNI